MAVYVFHGDDTTTSDRKFTEQLAVWRQAGRRVVNLSGRELTLEMLQAATSQDDFFAPPPALAIRGLFARPKSKARDSVIAALGELAELDVALWEGKKLTPANLKLVAGAQVIACNAPDKIWGLLARLSPQPDQAELVRSYQETMAQLTAKGDASPGIYVLAMVIWKVQQLIDAYQGNYTGAPFQRSATENQARKFNERQLLDLHQRLIELDSKAKSSRLPLPLEQMLLLVLLGIA